MQIVSIVAECLASAIDCVLTLWCMVSYFGKKRKIRWWEYLIWFVLLFINGQFLGEYFDLQTFLMVVFVFAFSMVCLKGKWIVKLIGVLGIYILMAFINIGTIQIIALLSETPVELLIIPGSILRILVLCISKGTLCSFIYFIEKSLDKKQYLKREETILMIVLYGIFFIVSIISICIIATVEVSHTEQMRFLILSLLLFLVNVFLFYLIRKMNYQNRCELENGILKVQLEQQEKLIYNTERLYQDARKIRHDMKHYFTTYLQLLKDGDTDIVIEEMQNMLQTQLDVKNFFYMDSKMLNAVINQKASVCKEEEIPFEVQITGDYNWENESNIAILLSNLLDNAIEAERHQGGKKEIVLKMFVYKEDMNIIVENYIAESVLEQNPNLSTTKQNKTGHGIGMGSIREIVRQEEGILDILEEENHFIIHILIPDKQESEESR